jgi:hypothetical protein
MLAPPVLSHLPSPPHIDDPDLRGPAANSITSSNCSDSLGSCTTHSDQYHISLFGPFRFLSRGMICVCDIGISCFVDLGCQISQTQILTRTSLAPQQPHVNPVPSVAILMPSCILKCARHSASPPGVQHYFWTSQGSKGNKIRACEGHGVERRPGPPALPPRNAASLLDTATCPRCFFIFEIDTNIDVLLSHPPPGPERKAGISKNAIPRKVYLVTVQQPWVHWHN